MNRIKNIVKRENTTQIKLHKKKRIRCPYTFIIFNSHLSLYIFIFLGDYFQHLNVHYNL